MFAMTPETTDWIKLVAQLAALAVSCIAIWMSLRAENRNQKRFQRQLALQETVASANVRPILDLSRQAYSNYKGIVLTNHGAGTAVITSLSFLKEGEGKEYKSLDQLLDYPNDLIVDEIAEFDSSTMYLPPRTEEILFKVTLDDEDVDDRRNNILQDLEKQIDLVRVKVTYQDVFGKTIEENKVLK